MKKILLLLFLCVSAAAIVSCNKTNDPNTHPKDRLISILLGKDTLDMYVGQTRLLPLTISPSNYNKDSLLWKSSDTTVLSISNIGLIKAKKVGAANVSVSNIEKTTTLTCLVTVSPAPVDSLKIGLLAYYPFNNNSGVDSSGNHFDAYKLTGLTPTTDRNNVADKAFLFNGVNSYAAVRDISALVFHNTDFTMNAWVKLSDYSSSFGCAIISKRVYNSPGGYVFSITGYTNTFGVSPGLVTFGPGGPYKNALGTQVIDVGKWHMVTVVYSVVTKMLTIYVDGKFDNTTDDIASVDTQAIMYIGFDNPNVSTDYGLNGSINDIRMYNRALPPSQITKLYKITD